MTPQRLAIETALRSKHPRYKLGAVLASKKGNGILDAKSNLATGCKTDGVCAEERLLRRPPRAGRSGGTALYVARVLRRDGSPAMAKPCPKCQKLIEIRGVEEVYFTNEEGEWERMF